MSETKQRETEETADVETPSPAEMAAAKRGWKPEDQYEGPPGTWKSADEFLKTGDEIALSYKNRSLQSKIRELESTVAQFTPFMTKAIEAEKARTAEAIKQLKAERAQAVASGDAEAYTRADDALEVARQQAAVEAAQPSQLSPVAQAFVASNSDWHEVNAEATAYAHGVSNQIRSENPHIGEAAFYAELEKRVRASPFVGGRAREAAPVENGDRSSRSTGSGGYSYANLPPAAKKQCTEFLKTIPGFTKEMYVENYEWEAE